MSYFTLLCWSQVVFLPTVCGSQFIDTKSPGDDICLPLPWTSFNPTTSDCMCNMSMLSQVVECSDNGHSLTVRACFCIGVKNDTVLVGNCIYTCFLSSVDQSFSHLISVENVSSLNDNLCSRYNRTGFMCGACVEGYAPPVYSYTLDCVECSEYQYNWLKYFAMAFIPQTIFYFLVIVLNISVTSGTTMAYVAISQIVTSPSLVQFYLLNFGHHVLVKWILALYTVWNLDILRSVYSPFCLHPDLPPLFIISLDYVVGIYPLLLILLTFLAVKVHDRFVFCVRLCAPLTKALMLIHHNWDIRTSLIKGFASFLILSYVKLLNVSVLLLTPSDSPRDLDNKEYVRHVRNDGTVEYFSLDHLPYAITAIFMLVVFNIFPLLLVCLYPFQCFQKCLNCFHLNQYQALHTLMDALQGCYQHTPRDCRHFATLYLLLRIMVLVLYFLNSTLLFYSASSILLICSAIIVAIWKPYKHAVYSTLDVVLLLFAASAGLAVSIYVEGVFVDPTHFIRKSADHLNVFGVLIVLLLPLYGFSLAVWKLLPSKVANYIKCKVSKIVRRHQDYTSIEELPHRLLHSTDY